MNRARAERYKIGIWTAKLLGFNSSSGRRIRHSIGSYLVTAFSVVPIIVVVILTNGMTSGITEKYIDLQSGHLRITAAVDAQEIVDSITDAENDLTIVSVHRIVDGYGVLYTANGTYSASIRGVDDAYFSDPEIGEEFSMIAGTMTVGDPRALVISEYIADLLDVKVGDRVAVAYSTQSRGGAPSGTGAFLRPAIKSVTGIFTTGYSALDEQLAYIQDSVAREMLGDAVEETVVLRLDSDDLAVHKETAASLKLQLGDRVTDIQSWDEQNAALFRNFAETKNILLIIMAVIIVIASVNISSSCIMLIQENYINIGIMKALGYTSASIRNTFLLALLMVVGFGAITGVGLGLLLGLNINGILAGIASTGFAATDFYLISIPISIRFLNIIYILLFTVGVASLAILLPLRRVQSIRAIQIISGM